MIPAILKAPWAAVWGMSAGGRWAPHAHAGLSVALQASARVRLLAEAVGDVHRAGPIGVGPTVKMALAEGTSLTAAVLMEVVGRPGFSAMRSRSIPSSR
jgi:hypothetical protein